MREISFNEVFRRVLFREMMFRQKNALQSQCEKGASHVNIWGKSVPGRGRRKCGCSKSSKGPVDKTERSN